MEHIIENIYEESKRLTLTSKAKCYEKNIEILYNEIKRLESLVSAQGEDLNASKAIKDVIKALNNNGYYNYSAPVG